MFFKRFSCFSNTTGTARKEKPASCFSLGKALTKKLKEPSTVLLSVDSFLRNYQQGPIIGKGGFGAVHAGIRRSDKTPVAIKYIRKRQVIGWGSMNGEELPLEYILLRQVSHLRGAIKLLDAVSIGGLFVIIMERMEPSKDLFHLVAENGPLPEKLAKCYFRQIAESVVGCLLAGVFHRDIKAENIMVNPETQLVKLIDFGCGTNMKRGRFTKPIGTPCYFPPELFCNGWYYGEHATVWSLGVLLYFMICGELPFRRKKEIVQALVRIKADVSPDCRDLVRKMLEFSPDQRLTLHQIALHPWLADEKHPTVQAQAQAQQCIQSFDEGVSSWNTNFATSSPLMSEPDGYWPSEVSTLAMSDLCGPVDSLPCHQRHHQCFARSMAPPVPTRLV